MTRWSKNQKEFTVAVNHYPKRASQINVPKPVLEMLGMPDTVTFVVSGKTIRIRGDMPDEC